MPQIRSLIAACALLVSLGSAQANVIRTFDVSGTTSIGTFSGTLTIDVTAGKVTGVNIIHPGIANFTKVLGSGPRFGRWNIYMWNIYISNASDTSRMLLDFTTAPNPGSLVGFSGGTILFGDVHICVQGSCTQTHVSVPDPHFSVRTGGTIRLRALGTIRFGPGTPTEAFGPCLTGTIFLPYCALGMPACTKPIPCKLFGQPASTCAEWVCAPPNWRIPRPRGARRG
jgi:hypothetical protein